MTHKPFDITRWESAKAPTQELLGRLLEREGLQASLQELPDGTHTAEMKFEQAVIRVVISGQLQAALPGYGVIAIHPGDMLEIEPNILHDITVVGTGAATVFEAFRA